MSSNVLYGVHAVLSKLQNQASDVSELFLLKGRKDQRIQPIINQAKAKKITITYLDKASFQSRFDMKAHQGVVALCHNEAHNSTLLHERDLYHHLEQKEGPLLILLLDTITDPHNLGAILRSAEALGVDVVIAPKDKSVGLTPAVRKVACGAAELIPFVPVTNLARCIETLQSMGVWVYGACGEAESSLQNLDFKGHSAIVMGAEGKGLRQLTRTLCDGLFHIPMMGQTESLNVSVATGICLYEVFRQRA